MRKWRRPLADKQVFIWMGEWGKGHYYGCWSSNCNCINGHQKKKIAVHKQQGKGIDANLELENKTWMCCLSTHFTTFDHWPEKKNSIRVCLKSNCAWVQLTGTLAASLIQETHTANIDPCNSQRKRNQLQNLMLTKRMKWISQENSFLSIRVDMWVLLSFNTLNQGSNWVLHESALLRKLSL